MEENHTNLQETKENQKITEEEKLKSFANGNKYCVVPTDFLTGLAKKIDNMADNSKKYVAEQNFIEWATGVRSRQKFNRATIEKILWAIPALEKSIQGIDEKDSEFQQYYSSLFVENDVMGSGKNSMTLGEWTEAKNDMQTKATTKFLLTRIKKLLDDYLNSDLSINIFNPSKKNQDRLEAKKIILRRYYGYGLRDNVPLLDELGNTRKDKNGKIIYGKEETVKRFDDLCEIIHVTNKVLYIYKNELLDDLAPSFFGIDGVNI